MIDGAVAFTGGYAAISADGSLAACSAPPALWAVTITRILDWTSFQTNLWVGPVAPSMSTQ